MNYEDGRCPMMAAVINGEWKTINVMDNVQKKEIYVLRYKIQLFMDEIRNESNPLLLHQILILQNQRPTTRHRLLLDNFRQNLLHQ